MERTDEADDIGDSTRLSPPVSTKTAVNASSRCTYLRIAGTAS